MSLYEHKPLKSKMSFDASTPQLKAVKNMFDALISFDLGKIAALTSKNYQYEAFNGADLAKLDKESYAAMIQGVSTVVTKVDVSIRQWRTIFDPTD